MREILRMRFLISIALLFGFSSIATAQPTTNEMDLVEMGFSYTTEGEFTQLSASPFVRVTDDGSYLRNIGFTFNYDNYDYTRCIINSNGILTFYPYTGSYWNYYGRYITDNRPSVLVMRRDLYTRGGLIEETIGSAPNRIRVFEWRGIDFYYRYNANMNWQIRLHEGSNKIEIVFGSMNRGSFNFGSYYYYWAHLGFSGRSSSNWINVEQKDDKLIAHYSNSNPTPYYRDKYIRNSTQFAFFKPGVIITLKPPIPELVETIPADGAIFKLGEVFTGADHPGVVVKRDADQAEIRVSYKISGPLPTTNPDFQTIYTATAEGDTDDEWFVPSPQPVGDPTSFTFTHAKGIAARQSPENDGALDLQTNQTQIPGGAYMIEAVIDVPDEEITAALVPPRVIYLAFDNDLMVNRINAPRDKSRYKYPIASGAVPVEVKFTNIGINDVTSFDATARIWDPDGNLIYENTYRWEANPNGLRTGENATISFPNFAPRGVGDFRFEVEADLLNAIDQADYNNIMPRSGESYYFNVAHEIEAASIAVLAPAGDIYVGRPIRPQGKFLNVGVSDISDVPATMTIIELSSGDIVYYDEIIIQDIPSGRFNTATVFYSTNFIPPSAGSYQVCITVDSPDDPVTDNNEFCDTFEVVDALSGTYTIGTTYSGPRNFPTIQDAVDALFLQGVTGGVAFQLTDSDYQVGDMVGNTNAPALDFRSKIIGVDAEQTITFVPSSARSLVRGGINITMSSDIGIGTLFGQEVEPANTFAAVHIVTPGLKPLYANSAGYITFDGGSQKAFNFLLNTTNDFRAPIFLGNGAANIVFRNCLVGNADANNKSYQCQLPRYVFDDAFGFIYGDDDPDAGNTYSAGIVIRSKTPYDDKTQNNFYGIDTLTNKNLVIENMEISGFGYGIVSIGAGVLYRGGHAEYTRYYNENNTFGNNIISDVSRAGIFLGYENNTVVKNNRIYDIHGDCNGNATGILAGGMAATDWYGYNNMNLSIDGNEISGISGSNSTSGIYVEQTLLEFYDPTDGRVVFPNGPDNIQIENNIVWGFEPDGAATHRGGIFVLTGRDENFQAAVPGYFTTACMIANNTIVIDDDGGIMNTGDVLGVGLIESDGAVVENNAIAILDQSIDASGDIASGIYFYGQLPEDGGIYSDRNAFYLGTSNASIYRFEQTDENGNIIQPGTRDEFTSLNQWRQWTGADMHSVAGNFLDDMEYIGNAPTKLRVVSDPYPLGSILNNGGKRIDDVVTDIDGTLRGQAGQRYDIGAIEFDGRVYVSDVEVTDIPQPGAYKENLGTFNDAEYVMTTSPVEIMAMVKNNGSLNQNGIEVTLRLYLENADGNFPMLPVMERTVTADIPAQEHVEVPFGLAGGGPDDFHPRTFANLRGGADTYTVPFEFITMEPNVTPRYRIVVSVESDQRNANNILDKVVRFYIQRANLSMLISSESSNVDISAASASIDQIAGNLNHNDLVQAINTIGWKIDIDNDIFDFDIFERTGWEPKSVNYDIYGSVFWSDGDDKPMTRFEKMDIENFFDSFGSTKKNFVAASQELVREQATDPLINDYFRSELANPGNPLGVGISYAGNRVIGRSLGRNIYFDVDATGFDNGTTADVDPYPGLVNVISGGEGLARVGFVYENTATGADTDVMGVSSVTLSRNVVSMGVDWRHFSDVDAVVRTLIDFIENNNGIIIPVELLSFDAEQVGNHIALNWTTASEIESSHFDIERAVVENGNPGNFAKIDEIAAAGNTTTDKNYGPIADYDVEFGSTYVYRLKLVDLDGEWDYSGERQVTLAGNAGSLRLGNVEPNPVSTTAEFEYELGQAASIALTVYDVNGKAVLGLFSGPQSAGVHNATIDPQNIASGSYTIVLQAGDVVLTKTLNVVK